tara:strand:- start:114 stop:776 length:663 start_codon:yes stop_codon:yes gene_type:complete
MAPRKKKEAKDGHVIELNGKEYITHIGLLDLAHKAGLQGWDGDWVQPLCDPEKDQYVYKVRVWNSDGMEFSAHGQASPRNLNRMMVPFACVMAETRAWNRALRSLVNHGGTTADEMKSVGIDSQPVEGGAYTYTEARQMAESNINAAAIYARIAHGPATPEEVEKLCLHWSKGKITVKDLLSNGDMSRMVRLLEKVESEEGVQLLNQWSEEESKKEGVQS